MEKYKKIRTTNSIFKLIIKILIIILGVLIVFIGNKLDKKAFEEINKFDHYLIDDILYISIKNKNVTKNVYDRNIIQNILGIIDKRGRLNFTKDKYNINLEIIFYTKDKRKYKFIFMRDINEKSIVIFFIYKEYFLPSNHIEYRYYDTNNIIFDIIGINK